jgi:predicted transcriptional regulator of viral defense system
MSAASEYKKMLNLRNRLAEAPTMTGQVRAAMKHLGVFDYIHLENLVPQHPERRIRGVITEFIKTGEIEKLGNGVYRYAGKTRRRTLLDVIWHLVRSRKRFSTDDIERLSSAARDTVLEYLHCLAHMGYIRQARRGIWQLVNDPGPDTPVNTTKCARLKRIRKKQGDGR